MIGVNDDFTVLEMSCEYLYLRYTSFIRIL